MLGPVLGAKQSLGPSWCRSQRLGATRVGFLWEVALGLALEDR